MSNAQGQEVNIKQTRAFLAGLLNAEPTDVVLVGEGAWSQCYGFTRGHEDLVIRFGNYVDDFRRDQLAHAYATPDLPIPEVLDIGHAFDGYYAISTRARGVPLESLSTAAWRATVPSVVAALEAMRTADLSSTSGFGGWGIEGKAQHNTWSDRLLAIGDDTPDQRGHGWRDRLAASPPGDETFTWGYNLLKSLVGDSVPRCLVHSDLVNRNVLVDEGRIAGVFDWGCSVYGDHLHDLAWFEFWAPWFPKLDIPYLRSELEERWHEVGYRPENQAARLRACHLHIGLEHLAYNASLGDWPALEAVAERMRVVETRVGA